LRRPARPTITYGAALAAGGIALASALVAWARLQDPAPSDGLVASLASDAVLGVALPLLVVGAVMSLTWLVRRLFAPRRRNGPANSGAASQPGTGLSENGPQT
jgi:hypothetical protein